MSAVNGEANGDGGVACGELLVAFVEAVMGEDAALRHRRRDELRAALTPEQFVDTCAVIAAFNVVDRIADSTGIPLDAFMRTASASMREELGLARFASAANTP